MNLYFTSEIGDALDLFGTPMALKTCYSYICNDGVQFHMEIRKINRRRPRFVDTAKLELVISRCCFAEDGKEMYQELFRTSTAIVLLIKPFVW